MFDQFIQKIADRELSEWCRKNGIKSIKDFTHKNYCPRRLVLVAAHLECSVVSIIYFIALSVIGNKTASDMAEILNPKFGTTPDLQKLKKRSEQFDSSSFDFAMIEATVLAADLLQKPAHLRLLAAPMNAALLSQLAAKTKLISHNYGFYAPLEKTMIAHYEKIEECYNALKGREGSHVGG